MSDDASASNVLVPTNARTLKPGDDCILKGRAVQLTDVSIKKAGKHGHDKVLMRGTDVLSNEAVEDWVSATRSSVSDVLLATVQRIPARVVCVNDESSVSVERIGVNAHINVADGATRGSLPAAPWIVEQLVKLPSRGVGTTVLAVVAPVVSRWEYDRSTMSHNTGQSYHTAGSKMGAVALQTRVVGVALELPAETTAAQGSI
jgi:hypothetical protein